MTASMIQAWLRLCSPANSSSSNPSPLDTDTYRRPTSKLRLEAIKGKILQVLLAVAVLAGASISVLHLGLPVQHALATDMFTLGILISVGAIACQAYGVKGPWETSLPGWAIIGLGMTAIGGLVDSAPLTTAAWDLSLTVRILTWVTMTIALALIMGIFRALRQANHTPD